MPRLGFFCLKPGNMVKSMWNGHLTFVGFQMMRCLEEGMLSFCELPCCASWGCMGQRRRGACLLTDKCYSAVGSVKSMRRPLGVLHSSGHPQPTFLVASDRLAPFNSNCTQESEASDQSSKTSKLTSRKLLLRKMQIWVRMGRLRTKERSFLICAH